MKKYRIYKANVFNEKGQFISTKDLNWTPTEFEYDNRYDAIVKYVDMQSNDNENYYSVKMD
jgi:hypothetical protein